MSALPYEDRLSPVDWPRSHPQGALVAECRGGGITGLSSRYCYVQPEITVIRDECSVFEGVLNAKLLVDTRHGVDRRQAPPVELGTCALANASA